MSDRRSARAGFAGVARVAGAFGAAGLLACALLAQSAGPSLETLEKYRRDTLLAGGFAPLVLGGEAERQVSLVAGKGQPLLFLHGVGNQGSSWFEVAPAFVARYRVVVPDLPGHGESAPAAGDLPMATVVAGAERLLLEVTGGPPERPAIVVGNSMGAWLATLLALRHPERVERIVLVNGGALAGRAGRTLAAAAEPRAGREADGAAARPGGPAAPRLAARRPRAARADRPDGAADARPPGSGRAPADRPPRRSEDAGRPPLGRLRPADEARLCRADAGASFPPRG